MSEYRHKIAGVIILFLGVVFLLMNLGIIPPAFSKFWPFILIIIGVAMILKKNEGEKGKK